MPESKFLKHQDKNNDGLIDVCDDLTPVQNVNNCLPCTPNPYAVLPDWKTLTAEDPLFNEKNCTYQVTIVTKLTSIFENSDYEATTATEEEAQETIDDIFNSHQEEAIEALLTGFEKVDDEASRQALRDEIEHKNYDLDPRPKSPLLLLYTVPYEALASLDDVNSPTEDEKAEEDAAAAAEGRIVVTYKALELAPKLMRIRKGLALYNIYLKKYQALDKGNLFFEEEPDTIFNLKIYGDWGGGVNCVTAKLLKQLEAFLNMKGAEIPGVGRPHIFKGHDTVTKLTFHFDTKYKLKKLEVYTEGCGDIPRTYIKSCRNLRGRSAWRDPTAAAYFAHLDDMDNDLTARTPKPWLDFVIEHTYPKIYSSINHTLENLGDDESCVAAALRNEVKQLGQDILDDVFNVADAIALKYSETCYPPGEEGQKKLLTQEKELGMVADPNASGGTETESFKNLRDMALVQAQRELEKSKDPFERFCGEFIAPRAAFMTTAGIAAAVSGGGAGIKEAFGKVGSGAFTEKIQELWEDPNGLQDLKLCGLQDLLIGSIQCLFKGMTLEQALGTILNQAFRSMSMQNFDKLFIGLPYEKQLELQELVKKKLAEGDLFKDEGLNQATSDAIAGLTTPNTLAELEPGSIFSTYRSQDPNIDKDTTITEFQNGQVSQLERRPLNQRFDPGANENRTKQLSDKVLLEVWIKAYLEVYRENLLELVAEFNKFPGAQLVKFIITTVDCPRPPLWEPSVLDFIKDIELPFCKGTQDIVWPHFTNPFAWLADRADLGKLIHAAAILALQELIWTTIMRILLKVCQLLSSASCSLLDLTMPDFDECGETDGRLRRMIQDALCGDAATSAQVDDTMVDVFARLGLGSAAFADQQQVLNFGNDMSCTTTRQELAQAFLGEPTEDFLNAIGQLVATDYTDFEAALPNNEAIEAFFTNMGALAPVGFRTQLGEFLAMLPEEDRLPANPSLCATEEQVQRFEEYRCSLLEGRATPDQCKTMFPDYESQLDEFSQIMEGGFGPTMPPIVSAPGCDDGIFPFETPDAVRTVTKSINSNLELLQMNFMTDMMGNGGLFGGLNQSKWGFMNMILSDTYGKPLTSHHRQVARDRGAQTYVDMYVQSANSGDAPSQGDRFWNDYDEMDDQYGAYPIDVAGWLQFELGRVEPAFISNNQLAGANYIEIEQGAISDFNKPIDRLSYTGPQYYNVEVQVDFEEEQIFLLEKDRKAAADVKLDFRDNNQGLASRGETNWGWGFDIDMYLSEFAPTSRPSKFTGAPVDAMGFSSPPWELTGVIANRPDDNARITISEFINDDADYKCRFRKVRGASTGIDSSPEKLYDFLAVDNTFEQIGNINLDNYPNFIGTFKNKQAYLPQVVLLHEIATNNGAVINKDDIKVSHDLYMSSLMSQIKTLISDNDIPFRYGASFEGVTEDDVQYVVNAGQTLSDGGTRYRKAKVEDEDGGERKIKRSDQILGISQMQYEVEQGIQSGPNRVFYLDPNTYGGSFMNPPIYIAPNINSGWLGLFDILFPEYSVCGSGAESVDLIDFGELSKIIDDAYPTMPVDERLKGDPDCQFEPPYHRILERSAAAGLEGLLAAAVRIYASVHFIKSIATFSTIKPDFKENFSTIYAQYIISRMEERFRDAQAPASEFFNTFKDDEFWYVFLEQAVQSYSRNIERTGTAPPSNVNRALTTINNMIENYDNPSKKDMEAARELGDFRNVQVPFDGMSALEEYRYKKNLEAVMNTEDEAKIILQELVTEQLDIIATKFETAMKKMEMAPSINDIGYYFLQNLTQGADGLDLEKEIKEEVQELPTEGSNIYTPGGELYVLEKHDEDSGFEAGDEYVGYYHIVEDDDGDPQYMAGEEHVFAPHDVLNPMGNKIIVPIGNVEDYKFQVAQDPDKPFAIEKYISIDDVKYSSSDAINKIKQHDNSLNISEVYPGTLEHVVDAGGRVVGLKGKLGVRYGLQFSLVVDGEKMPLTTVEIDALDLPISKIAPFEGNSKTLLCLLNLLKEDHTFKLIYKYIFPLNKINALWAVYNDMGFLASIGEITVGPDEALKNSDPSTKPGLWIEIDSDGNPTVNEGAIGWADVCKRRKGGAFVLDWDDWDRELLSNSTHRLKKMFKNYYHSRTFSTDITLDPEDDPSWIWFTDLRNRMRPSPGVRLLPWWKRRRIRKGVQDSKGNFCDKK